MKVKEFYETMRDRYRVGDSVVVYTEVAGYPNHPEKMVGTISALHKRFATVTFPSGVQEDFHFDDMRKGEE